MLDETTVDDAREVYTAIRRAAPGGLGQADAQDVANEPTLPLVDVMRLAADRDGIAREYATAFEATFGTGVPALEQSRGAGLSWDDAIVETFLTLLAAAPDTHVARRGGTALAAEVSRRARTALAAGGVRSEAGRQRHRRTWIAGCATRATPPIPAPPRTSRRRQSSSCCSSGGWHASDGGHDAAAR